jgi:tricorn protease
MLAETSQSHISLRAPAPAALVPAIPVAGLLGADYTVEHGMYRFARIYRGPESPLTAVADGEYLIAVNDRPLRPTTDLFAAFEGAVGKPTWITVNTQPSETGARRITVTPIQNEQPLRYSAWIEDRYRRVREAGGGRIAYIHVPIIEQSGADSFREQFNRQSDAEALILDVRNDNGGTMTDFFLDFLSRCKERNLVHRSPAMHFSLPEFAVAGPKILLINEQSVSGAEDLAYLAQRRKIATLVGTRTNGSLIGTGAEYRLEDGTVMMIPEFAQYTIDDGKWYPEGKGVVPDLAVDQRADLVADGKDPQLEKAIEIALDKLKQMPQPPQPENQ